MIILRIAAGNYDSFYKNHLSIELWAESKTTR
jgi:hypothetical protein